MAAAVRRLVDRLLHHLDAAEPQPDRMAQEFVVIARDVEDTGALRLFAQQPAHHGIV
jgi:signal transduction protein with GAF and PtsI domain